MPLDLQRLRSKFTDQQIVDNFGSQLGVDVAKLRSQYDDTVIAENLASQYDSLASKKVEPEANPVAPSVKDTPVAKPKFDHGAIPVVSRDAPAAKPWLADSQRMLDQAAGLSAPGTSLGIIADADVRREEKVEASKDTLKKNSFKAASEEVSGFDKAEEAKRKAVGAGIGKVKADQARAKRREGRPGIGRQILNDTSRGVSNLANIGTALVALGDDALGLDEISKEGLRAYVVEADRIAAENPAVIGSFKNIKSASDFGRYAIEAVFENAAMFIPSLVTGGIGTTVAKQAAEKMVAGMVAKQVAAGATKEAAEKSVAGFVAKQVAKGATVGALPAGVGMEAGSIYGDIYKETGKQEAGVAAGFGALAGALDIVEPVLALRKALGPVADDVAQSIYKRYGPEVAKQVLAEGSTEFAQTLVESGAVSYVDGREWLSEENLHHAIDGMLKGGIAGGVLGAGSQAVADARRTPPTDGGLTPPAEPTPAPQVLQASADEAAQKSREFATLADEARAMGNAELASQYETESQAAAAAAKQALDTLQAEHTGLQGIVNRTGITPPALIPEEAPRTVDGELLPADGGSPLSLPSAAQAQGQLPRPDEQVMVADSQGNVAAMGVNSVNAMRQGAIEAQRDAVIDRGDLIVPSDAVPAAGKSKPRPVNPAAAGLSAARIPDSGNKVAATESVLSGSEIQAESAPAVEATGEQEMRKRMAYLRGAIAASGDEKFKAAAKTELRELTNKINSLKNADPATVSPETVPAPAKAEASPFSVEFGGRRFPVPSVKAASELWTKFRDETGAGASEIGNGVPVFDATGKQVARISYNGRAWEGEPAIGGQSKEIMLDGRAERVNALGKDNADTSPLVPRDKRDDPEAPPETERQKDLRIAKMRAEVSMAPSERDASNAKARALAGARNAGMTGDEIADIEEIASQQSNSMEEFWAVGARLLNEEVAKRKERAIDGGQILALANPEAIGMDAEDKGLRFKVGNVNDGTGFRRAIRPVTEGNSDPDLGSADFPPTFFDANAVEKAFGLPATPRPDGEVKGTSLHGSKPKKADTGKQPAAKGTAGPEQAIRDAFNATPVTIGAWKPITVSANGRTQQFLAMQKSINSQGRSTSPIYLINIKMGRMIAGAEIQPIAQVYKLSGSNSLAEEGGASPASAEQIKAWKDAGFDGLTAAAAPKTGASPTGLNYPNRKLGFEFAKAEDGGDPNAWANIALANLQPGDVVKVGNDSLTVKSIGAKAVTFTKPDGKTTRFDVDTPRMEKLVRDVADLLGASHHSSHGRDWVSVLSRDPTFGRTAGVINLQDRGTEATASVDAMNLAARHARLDRAIDQLSDTEVHALYRKMGLAGELLNVDKKREALKQEHPDDTEAAMKARPEAAKPEVSDNTVFTEDAAEKAREVLRQALRGTQLNTGLDPKVLQAALTLSGYHVERGARTFAAYSQAMIKDLGDEVRPYLKSFYMALKYDPKAASIAEGMSSEAEVNAEPRTEDRRQSDEAVANDRRRGPRRVDDMTTEEMRQALLINPLTDLPNKRAFEEDADLGWPHVAAMDIDGFGFLNDIWGHDPVDAILKQIGGMMSEFSTDAVRLYHRSGDEFAARSNDKEALQLVLKSLQDHLEASTFTVDGVGEDGRPLKFIKHGIGVTFGISTDYQRADNEANADKERRLAAGQRGAKGTNPGGMVEVDAEGVHADLGKRGLSRQETERLRNRGSERGLDPEQEAANRQEDIRQQRSQRMRAMLVERSKLKPTDELLTAVAKLGGLSKADAEAQGIDPAYFSEQRAGIKFVFRPSGKSFDAMAEALDAEGYPVQDDQGRYSANTLLDLVTRSLSGSPVYTSAGYDAVMAAEDVQRALEEGDTAALPPSEIAGYSPEESVVIVSFNDVINSGYDWTTVYRMIGDNDTEAEIHRLFAGLIAGDQEYVERYHTEAANLAGAAGVPSQAEEAENEDLPGFGEGQAADDLTDDELTRHLNGESLESIRASRLADDFSLSTQTEEDLREKEAREQDADSAEEADRQRQIDATADNFTLSTGTGTAGEQVRPAVRGGGRDLFASPAPSQISDAGDSLHWNRKNPWRSGGLNWADVADKNVTLRMKMAVKSKIWAKPDWEEYLAEVPDNLRDAVTLAARMVKQVYDAIATKPRTEAGVKDYIESVTRAREAAEAFLKDTDAVREFALAMAAKAQARLARRVSILDVVGTTSQADKKKSQPLFAAMFPESIGQRRFAESEEGMARAIGRKAVAALQFDIADVVKAMKDISDNGWPSKREAWQVRGYTVVERDGVFVLRHKPGGSRFTRDISEHGSEAEAIEAARALVARPQSETEPRPEAIALDRLTRTGPHRRQAGEDVTPQDLIDTFGFRGINFGNYVPNDERQAHVNHAFDSMLDLAEALDLPPAAMSLGGMLGLAFGAQGNGGKNGAHFVPGVNEINLTRKSGAGALAHEWAHAVDHYFGVLGGLATAKEPFASWLHMFRRTGESSIRPEVKSAFESIVNAMQKSKETIGDARNRIESYRVTSKQNLDAHIARYALDDKVAGNAEASAALGQIKNGEPGEYVEKPRRPRQRRAEATNANVLAVAQAAGLDNVDLELLAQAARSYSFAMKEAVDEANLRTVHTEFYRDSRTADRDDKRDYWATNHEMFARAFEAYVLDKLASKEARNDYLVKASIAEGAVAERALKVYPIGADRKAINDGFDALFGTVQHKQEDGKTLLYSRGFHGSPHRFDKFSLEHLGSGEGNQAYGWGLYFAGRREVAEHYRNALSRYDALPLTGPVQAAGAMLDAKVAEDRMRRTMRQAYPERSADQITADIEQAREAIAKGKGGQLYEVSIPDDDEYLLWDKPLSEQPEKVRAAIEKAMNDDRLDDYSRMVLRKGGVGAAMYETLKADDRLGQSDKAASEFLHSLGVAGVKYLDGSSRNRPLKDIKREFLAELPEDAEFDEVQDLIGTGRFSPANDVLLTALADNDWLGFDYPAQAISTALSRDLPNYDPTPELMAAVNAAQEGGTYNYVVFDDSRVSVENTFYSRGGSGSGDVARVEHLIAPILAKWKNGPRVVIVQAASDLPGGAAPHDVEGAYSGNGVVYLVADNLPTEERIMEVLAHEAVGHAAIESMLGADLMAELTKEIGAWERRGSAFFVKLGKDVDASQPDLPADRRAKEIVALMAERGLHKQGSLWKRVTGAIRAWLRDLGFTGKWLASLTDADMFKMLADAERYLVDGRGQSGKRNAEAALAYSRSGDTQAVYERRIDELFAGGKPRQHGIRLLDKSDMLDLLGMSNGPVHLAETKVEQGRYNHGLTADDWKRVPDWLENPVAVFDSETQPGRLVFIGPELVRGMPVRMIVEPRPDGGMNLLINAYDAERNPFGRWADSGLLRYFDKKRSAPVTGSFQPRLTGLPGAQGRNGKIYTGADLFKYRQTKGEHPLFSRASPSVVGDTYKLPPVRIWITRLFDRFDRIKQVQKAVKEQGGQIDLLSDVYGQEEAYHSRAASAIDRFRRHRMGAIFKRMARAGVSLEDVGLYLYAQHAPERNAQIAKLYANGGQLNLDGMDDIKMQDGGSGMTNAEAQAIMADFAQKGIANKLDTFARELRDITADTRQILRASGLESDDAIDAWEKAYQFYVPLSGKDEANNANTVIVGRGFDVRGGQKRAMGRKDKAKHIIEQIIVQHEQAVIRAEKNAVGKRLLQFVKNNPDGKLWEVNPIDQRRYIAADGTVEYRDQPQRTDRNVVAVRINGKDTFILLADQGMADAIHNVGMEDVGFMLRALGAVSRFTSKMFTAFSPAFIAINALRDFQTAMLHGYQVGGIDYSMAIAKNIPRAVAELVRDARGGNGQLVKLYEQSGGRTGMVYMIKDFEEKHNEVMRQMAALQGVSLREIQQAFAVGAKEGFKAIGRKARYNRFTGVFDAFVELVETFNGVVENTTRLAAFKAAMDAGKPAREAGSIAKNLTVNFNRKGELAPHLGSLYIFFNASVQGTVRMGEALKDRRLQVVAAGMFMASFLLAALQMDDDEDEDGRADFEQIPAWQRSRNLIIRGDGGDYYKIPLPLGWNVFHMLGTEAAVMLKSKSKEAYGSGAWNMLKQTIQAFNPVGDLTPSVAAPFIQILQNESAFGGMIYADYKDDLPDSQQFFDSTEGSAYERLTTWANDATGGNEFRAGLVDINPEKLEHVTEFFGGGALRFLTDTVDAVSAAVDGGPAQPADKLPIVRAFYGKLRDEYQTSRYYENKDKVSAVERELKGLQESGRYDEAAELMAEKPWVFGLSAMADGMDKQSKSIRELERLIRADDSLSDGERRARLQELRVLKGQAMKPFNAAYEESVRK